VDGSALTLATKRQRIDTRAITTSWTTTRMPACPHAEAKPTEKNFHSYNSMATTGSPALQHAGSETESLQSLLLTLRLLTTPRREEGGRCRHIPRVSNDFILQGGCGDANQRIIMQTLQKVIVRCRTCPWEAMDDRQTGESALSIICSLPFCLPNEVACHGERLNESPGVKEQLGFASTVVDAVLSVFRACPGQVHRQHGSTRNARGDTPLRRFLRNYRLLRLVMLADRHKHRSDLSRHLPRAGGPCRSESFNLFLKAAARITVQRDHERESLHDILDAWKSTVFVSDSCGQFPLDHLIRSILTLSSDVTITFGEDHRHLKSTPLDLLETFLQVVPSPFDTSKKIERFNSCHYEGSHFQPLIKLLAMACDNAPEEATRCMINMLVRWESTLLFRPSSHSGYLPMHVVLERPSQFLRPDDTCDGTIAFHLIQLYDESLSPSKQAIQGRKSVAAPVGSMASPEGVVWTYKNRKGEMPLHVACRAGASTSLLRVIMERTLSESKRFRRPDTKDAFECTECRYNPWIWSATNLGASPVDILWQHFLDPALSAHHQRCTRPVDRPAIDENSGNENDAEHSLSLSHDIMFHCIHQWKANVCPGDNAHPVFSKSLLTDPISSIAPVAPCAREIFLERIILVIRAAFAHLDAPPSSWLPSSQFYLLLHAVSALCVPSDAAPMVPESLLDLVLTLAAQQAPGNAVSQRDKFGRTALHYCFVSPNQFPGRKPTSRAGIHSKRKARAWEKWVMRLLRHEPALARTRDSGGRLPLHGALLFRLGPIQRETKQSQNAGNAEKGLDFTFASAKARVVEELTSLFPESILVRDRRTKLYPFLLAAANANTTLDLIYELLRRSPNALILFRMT
jgi:hypothetical protein